MARIDYFPGGVCSAELANALAGRRKINILRMVANSEVGGPGVLNLGMALDRDSSFDDIDREIVILRVAHLNDSAYELEAHTRRVKRLGLPEELVSAAASYPATEYGFTEHEITLIKFTDAVVANCEVNDELWERLAARYGPGELVELVLLIGFYMMIARVASTFEVDLETSTVTETFEFKAKVE